MRLGNLDSTPLLKAFRRLSYFDHVAKILQTAQNNSVKAPVEVALVTNVIYNPTGKLDIVKTTNQIVSTIDLGGAHA